MAELYRLPDDLDEPEAEPELARQLDIELDPPILFQKKPFTTLHLEEPTGAMVEAAEQELGATPTPYTLRRYQITLIARTAKVPREVIQQMRVGDIMRAFNFLSRLLDTGPPTGET